MTEKDWHEILVRKGFYLLESSTMTYGNGQFTGSITYEQWVEKLGRWVVTSKKTKKSKVVFCPFIQADNEFKPNDNYNSIVCRNEGGLEDYIEKFFSIDKKVLFDKRDKK